MSAQETIASQRDAYAVALGRLGDLQAQVDAFRAEPRAAVPALADNIRLAHQTEQAEHLLAIERAGHAVTLAKLQRFATRHPHLFAPDEVTS